ncbi:MAG: hypothetical protein HGA23_10205, partial [Bacteroidales bacterium]|nr:hypothetical protein [Bacteroidales bacterium]
LHWPAAGEAVEARAWEPAQTAAFLEYVTDAGGLLWNEASLVRALPRGFAGGDDVAFLDALIDRFDAIACNPYWANVARFFCGMFSKGELLDLADRVVVMTADSSLGKIQLPYRLASELLSDWVFSQTPKAMEQVS